MNTIRWLLLGLFCFTSHCELAHCQSLNDPPGPNDIVEIPSNGIVINTPGTYHIRKDLIWNPSGAGQAILITASNVSLDLHDNKIRSETTSFATIGIVAEGVANLKIKNGVIENMGLGGIKCEGCENIMIRGITVDGLNMNNTAQYTVPVGILITGSAIAVVKNCTVQNINVETGSLAAIQMTNTISSKISHCTISNILNRDGACTGIGHLLSDYAVVKSCTVDNLKSEFINNLNTEGHTAIGIVPVVSANLLIENCKVTNIIGCCDDAHGISIFECIGAVVKSCKVYNVIDGLGAAQSGAKATGIEVYGSGVKVIKCAVKNISAINPQDKQAAGFSCAQSVGVKFIQCRAENVTVVDENGNQNPALGYGVGFGWAPDPRPEFIFPAVDTLYKKCKAKNCQVGFDSWYHINSLWDDIESKCNQIPILNNNQPPRTLSCNPCSECGCLETGCYPTPITITLNNVAANNVFLNVDIINCK